MASSSKRAHTADDCSSFEIHICGDMIHMPATPKCKSKFVTLAEYTMQIKVEAQWAVLSEDETSNGGSMEDEVQWSCLQCPMVCGVSSTKGRCTLCKNDVHCDACVTATTAVHPTPCILNEGTLSTPPPAHAGPATKSTKKLDEDKEAAVAYSPTDPFYCRRKYKSTWPKASGRSPFTFAAPPK